MPPPACRGFDGVVCNFHPLRNGQQAIAKEDGRCVVCNPAMLQRACEHGQRRGCLVHHLRKILLLSGPIFDSALARVPEKWREEITLRAHRVDRLDQIAPRTPDGIIPEAGDVSDEDSDEMPALRPLHESSCGEHVGARADVEESESEESEIEDAHEAFFRDLHVQAVLEMEESAEKPCVVSEADMGAEASDESVDEFQPVAIEAQSVIPKCRYMTKMPQRSWERLHIPVPKMVRSQQTDNEANNVDPQDPTPVSQRRPTRAAKAAPKRDTEPSHYCKAVGCCFSSTALGEKARVDKGETQCMLCSPERLLAKIGNIRVKGLVTTVCRRAVEGDRQDIYEQVLTRLPTDADRERVLKAMQRLSQRSGARTERVGAKQWPQLLEHRVSFAAEPNGKEQREHQGRARDDNRRATKKFPASYAAEEAGDHGWRTEEATKFAEWCQKGAWVQCEKCNRLEKRSIEPIDIQGSRRACSTKACKHCKSSIGYPTVKPSDIPDQLRGLHKDVLWAIRPLDPFCGKSVWAKNGYRVHTDMLRMWWRAIPVREQIEMLEDRDLRHRAREVYAFIMASEESSYKKFIQMHAKFLAKHEGISDGDVHLQLPRRCIEEVGIECAIWPHLYPRTNMCETHVRFSDKRREERRERKKRARSRSSSSSGSSNSGSSNDSSDDQLNFAKKGRNSAKASYMAKVFGPVLGYGTDYELFQFVYDLWLWSSLGGKKHSAHIPIRLAMGGHSFTPEFWRVRHDALIDLVRQLGLPTLFITVAPYEWSFPYATWIEDEMKKMFRSRLHLPIAETLHMAHVLGQLVVGFLTGANRSAKKGGWEKHVFRARDGSGKSTVVSFFARLEFQDGKRRRYINMEEQALQYYHGRGTVHLHLLVWLENVDAIGLEHAVAATSDFGGDNQALTELVEGSQRSYTGSGWPVFHGDSHYDAATEILHLAHSKQDACTYNKNGVPEGLRAFLIDAMTSLKCHGDVQMTDRVGMLLRYVSSYVPKFSDSFSNEWLNDACSDYTIARRVLTDYHPLEPEMALQLAMQWFPQVFAGGSMKKFIVPVPWEKDGWLPETVLNYMSCKWRSENMTLQEYLRKATRTGCIQNYIKKRYKAYLKENENVNSEDLLTLEKFAVKLRPRGEIMIAASYLSRYDDRYYGQWVLMNVPFRKLEDLWLPELESVPEHLVHEALALRHRPDYWRKQENFRETLELEAFREHHVLNILAMLTAHHNLIDKYISGEFDKADYAVGVYESVEGDKKVLVPTPEQARITNSIVQSVIENMEQKAMQEDEWKGEGRGGSAENNGEAMMNPDEDWNDEASWWEYGIKEMGRAKDEHINERRAFAILGPAGSGKTTSVEAAVEKCYELGGRVLIVAPTGRLAATYRAKYPHLDVDTIHGAFLLYKREQETMELMIPYDLVIVEEIGQLAQWVFERLITLWKCTWKLTTLVFLGDFCQLPGVEATSARGSPEWKRCVRKIELRTMMRCKCSLLRKKLEILRTGKPSVKQLKFILVGHKAPSQMHRHGVRMSDEPTLSDVGYILQETPHTLFLTISRKACSMINEMAVASLFWDTSPLTVLPTDPESNIANYEGSKLVGEEPLETHMYKGMRGYLTKNLNKPMGYVNGMGGNVEGMDGAAILFRTDQGKLLSIYPWTSENHVVHYPIRLGSCSTLHKVQGATLDHVTVWLDIPNMPAAAYVALSRVRHDADWRFVGNPTVHHFTPARG